MIASETHVASNESSILSLSSSHCKLKESVCSIERRFHRRVSHIIGDLTTAENLHLSSFKRYVHENADQVLAERVYVIEVGKRASETVFDGLLHGLESGFGSRSHPARFIARAARAYGDRSVAQRESHFNPALTIGFFVYLRAIKSQPLLSPVR